MSKRIFNDVENFIYMYKHGKINNLKDIDYAIPFFKKQMNEIMLTGEGCYAEANTILLIINDIEKHYKTKGYKKGHENNTQI
tara:strand:+ start:614 stop:859 length:246 start_codon:yes stop_codon:yes gene_type:complete